MALSDKNRDDILLRILKHLILIREGLAHSHLHSKFHFEYEMEEEEKYLAEMKEKNKK